MKRILTELGKTGILPVVCLKNENELQTFTEALLSTPVRCIEITMRHPYSYEVIRYFKKMHPEFIVGAGTIVRSALLNEVASLGADYCVSPGFDENIIQEAIDKNMPFVPGCCTPSEFLKAQKYNMDTVKFFPAECSGGVCALKLYEGAFSEMSFLTTGGITLNNYKQYMTCKNVIACGGSFMVPQAMLQAGDAQGISSLINNCISDAAEVRA